MSKKVKPTPQQAKNLQTLFDFFNARLFDNRLDGSRVIMSWTRAHQVLAGMYIHDLWTDEEGNKVSELQINANLMKRKSVTELFSIVLHEMIHVEQHQLGGEGKAEGYHNAAFCNRSRELGLIPLEVCKGEVKPIPVGSGAHKVAQEIDPDGLFMEILPDMPEAAIFTYATDDIGTMGGGGEGEGEGEGEGGEKAPREPEEQPKKRGTRARLTCPACGLNAWAKHGAMLVCGTCRIDMVAAKE